MKMTAFFKDTTLCLYVCCSRRTYSWNWLSSDMFCGPTQTLLFRITTATIRNSEKLSNKLNKPKKLGLMVLHIWGRKNLCIWILLDLRQFRKETNKDSKRFFLPSCAAALTQTVLRLKYSDMDSKNIAYRLQYMQN